MGDCEGAVWGSVRAVAAPQGYSYRTQSSTDHDNFVPLCILDKIKRVQFIFLEKHFLGRQFAVSAVPWICRYPAPSRKVVCITYFLPTSNIYMRISTKLGLFLSYLNKQYKCYYILLSNVKGINELYNIYKR